MVKSAIIEANFSSSDVAICLKNAISQFNWLFGSSNSVARHFKNRNILDFLPKACLNVGYFDDINQKNMI